MRYILYFGDDDFMMSEMLFPLRLFMVMLMYDCFELMMKYHLEPLRISYDFNIKYNMWGLRVLQVSIRSMSV